MTESRQPEPDHNRTSLRRQQETIGAIGDPFGRSALRVAYHLRKYVVVYGVGVLAIITLAVLPGGADRPGGLSSALSSGGGPYGSGGSGGSGGTSTGTLPGGSTGLGTTGTVGGTGSGGTKVIGSTGASTGGIGGTGAKRIGGAQLPPGQVQAGQGVTRGGFTCTPGVHQLPYAQYTAPCVAKFKGGNGGDTFRGVTASTITFAYRHTSDSSGPNAQAVNAEAVAAGGVQPDTGEKYVKQLATYFNRTYELYGRHVKIVDFNGQGNNTDETLGNGQAGACADADTAANSVKAFADLNYQGLYESQPFSACAPRYKLMVPFGQLYYPESFYQKTDPYVWAITPNCTLGSQEAAEFIGKQVAPYPARYAGMDGVVNLKGKQRKFGNFIPNNAGYQECGANTKKILHDKYGVSNDRYDQYSYALDISQFPSDANKAAIQFSSDQDTSVILASDPIIPTFLTQACKNQNYFPEWLLIGVALTDQDNWAQLWDQSEVAGRLFGLSQLGSSKAFLDPKGEAAIALKAAGIPLNAGSALIYYEMVPIFNQLQAAGPVLNPASYAAGTKQLPVLGSPTGADGTWFYGTTHTGIIDSRIIYYNASGTSENNGRQGTYVVLNGGKRFKLDSFPTGEIRPYQ
jgi:hypothetical protein